MRQQLIFVKFALSSTLRALQKIEIMLLYSLH
jgi:hypothetical protein